MSLDMTAGPTSHHFTIVEFGRCCALLVYIFLIFFWQINFFGIHELIFRVCCTTFQNCGRSRYVRKGHFTRRRSNTSFPSISAVKPTIPSTSTQVLKAGALISAKKLSPTNYLTGFHEMGGESPPSAWSPPHLNLFPRI